jgi:hypothetical protein
MALASNVDERGNEDLADHVQTYRSFVHYTIIFMAHVAVILALLAYFFG